MTKYLLSYHGGTQPQTPEEGQAVMAAWIAWFERLGAAVVDAGSPVGAVRTIGKDRTEADGGGTNPVTGYSILAADSLAAAIGLARGCPQLDGSGSIEVAELLAMG